MRLSHFALVLAGIGIVVCLVWSLDAAILYFSFAVIVMLFAAYSSEAGRLTLKSMLWGAARIAAGVVGFAWKGFWVGFGFVLGVVALQSVAKVAEDVYARRSISPNDPGL